jgi:hypothetical protein
MRLVLIPLVLAALLAVGPTAVQANTNQAAAEKIAASLGEQLPGYDIAVSYQNGKVRLAGQVDSAQASQQAESLVRQIPGIQVSAVDNGIRVSSATRRPAAGAEPRIASVPVPVPYRSEYRVAARSEVVQPEPVQVRANDVPIPVQNPAYHPEAYGPQGPLPGQYNQPNLPQHAWPSYAAYPNYAQVSYPRQYSSTAWPYIGPFYPYPQVPLGWRKVTLEHHDGWWWLDFDDGTPSGPFSPLFRQQQRYTY